MSMAPSTREENKESRWRRAKLKRRSETELHVLAANGMTRIAKMGRILETHLMGAIAGGDAVRPRQIVFPGENDEAESPHAETDDHVFRRAYPKVRKSR